MSTAVAELPTEAAAIAFGRQGASVPDFDALFDALEAAQIRLATEGRLRCWVMLSRLAALGVRFDDAELLTSYLVPVLAVSAHEKRDVRRLIEEWLKSAEPEAVRDQRNAVQSAVPAPVRQLERADRTGRIVALTLGIAAAAAILGVVAWQVMGDDAQPIVKTVTDVATRNQAVVSLDLGLDPYWKDKFENLLSRLGFAAVVLVLGLSYAAWRGEVKGRLVRQVGEADLVETFRVTADSPGWFRTVDARAAFDRLKRVRWINTDQIDVHETVARSTRSGGLPVIANRRLRELPTYVLLVDRAAHDDHASLFAREIEAALTEARIVYSRYDFSGTLDRLDPVRSRRGDSVVDRENLPFSVVATRHTGERMILVGSGTEFFEVPGVRRDRSGRRIVVRPGTPRASLIHLREFSSASLFTPAPHSAWGEHERRLADAGFTLYSADVRGVENLAAQLINEADAPSLNQISPESSDVEQFLLWLDHNEMRLASDLPPEAEEIALLVRNLRIWSQRPEVFTLLAGIAAFPKIDPGFTFVLAGFIFKAKRDEAGAKGRIEPVIDSALYGRLTRLPWIRNGRMPDWLRIALVNALRPAQRETIRQIQLFMLGQAESARADQRALPSSDRLVALFEVARESTIASGRLEEAVSRIPTDDLIADERIFFSVLRGNELDPVKDVIQPEAPEVVAHRMEEPERRRRTRLRYAVFGIAAAVALLQPWLFDLGDRALDSALIFLATIAAPVAGVPKLPVRWVVSALMLTALTLWLFNMMRAQPQPRLPLSSWGLNSATMLDPRIPALLALLLSLHLLTPMVSRANDIREVRGGDKLLAPLCVLGWVWLVEAGRWWSEFRADDFVPKQLQRDWFSGTLGLSAAIMVWVGPWFLIALPTQLGGKPGQRLAAMAVAGAATAASSLLWRRWVFAANTTDGLQRLWIDFTWGIVTAAVCHEALMLGVPYIKSGGALVASGFLFVSVAMSVAGYYAVLRASLGITKDSVIWRSALNGMAITVFAVTLFGFAVDWIPVEPLTASLKLLFGSESPFGWRDETILIGVGSFIGAGLLLATMAVSTFRLNRAPGWQTSVRATVTALSYFAATFVLTPLFIQFPGIVSFVGRVFGFIAGADEELVAAVLIFTFPATLACWSAFITMARATKPDQPEQSWSRSVAENPWWATLLMWALSIGWQFGSASTLSFWPLALPVAIAFAWKNGARAYAPIAVGTLPLVVQFSNNPETGPFLTPGGLWPAIAIMFWVHFVADAAFRQRSLRRETLPWLEAAFMIVFLVMPGFTTPNFPGSMVSLRFSPDWMAASAAFVIGASRIRLSPVVLVVVAAWCFWTALDMVPNQGAEFVLINYDIGRLISFLIVLYAARAWRGYAVGFDRDEAIRDRNAFFRANRQQAKGMLLTSLTALVIAIPFSSWAPLINVGPVPLVVEPTVAAVLALAVVVGLIACRAADRSPYLDEMPGGWVASYSRAAASVPLLAFLVGPVLAVGFYFGLLLLVEPLALPGLGFDAIRFTLPRDVQYASLAGCALAFVLFGVALRIVAERRDGEALRDVVRRLWQEPSASVQEPSGSTQPEERELPKRASVLK